uniref:TBC1 domain family member 24 n=1 Tax=Mastacembelus armatus TaxID=205130 RepID=A0A3Q3KM10_9TELE
MTHTLRAKAYHHIIDNISSRVGQPHRYITPDRDVYYELAKNLFGEQKISTHPVPEYMETGEIPRYCLNKAGLNSVKKILLCLGKCFPKMNFCPILPALVSLILHFSQDEAECFHSVSQLICYIDPNKRYIDQTFLTYRASCMTFGDLANRFCRGTRKLIASSHQNLFEFYSDWTMWIFADLPFTYAIRVLDVYLLEGYKVLYRFVAIVFSNVGKTLKSEYVVSQDTIRLLKISKRRNNTVKTEKLLEGAFTIPMATRRELNLLFNANMESLKLKGVKCSILILHLVESVDFNTFRSSVVTGTEMRVVWAWIPERFALFNPIRLFSTTEHEKDLSTLYSLIEGHEPTVLMIKTVEEEVFGAFLSTDMTERRKRKSEGLTYFGTGECFVFTVRHIPASQRIFVPTSYTILNSPSLPHQRSSKMTSSDRAIVSSVHAVLMYCMYSLLGGDGGHALCIEEHLEGGYSEPCDTFKSVPLCKGNFKIQSLEVWGVQNPKPLSHFPSKE